MQRTQAVASLGQHRLMLPAWVKAGLSANDRLKVYLTVLQPASSHAKHPHRDVPDLSKEIAAAGLNTAWLHDLAAVARRVDEDLFIPDMAKLVKSMADDLATMARPVLETSPAGDALHSRVQLRLDWLGALAKDRLNDEQVEELTHGRRGEGDSLHLLVMDLHKKINKLAGELASEVIAGANVWELQPQDRPRVVAFMRGLNRTAVLKFDHPGLDTAATRDGEHQLIQNDIGTNDAHVLVIQVAAHSIALAVSTDSSARLTSGSCDGPRGQRYGGKSYWTGATPQLHGGRLMATANTLGQRLACFLARSRHVHGTASPAELARPQSCLRPGDVLLVEGNSRISTAIKYLTQSTWSHAALYVGPRPELAGAPCLVEADTVEGVRAVVLSHFAGLHLRVCRPASLSGEDAQRLDAHAIGRIGHRYDLRNIFDLARDLIPTPPVPLRWRRRLLVLGSGDPTRAICSPLIAQAFESVRYPILPIIEKRPSSDPLCPACVDEILHVRHHSLFVPRDFDVSPYFGIIMSTLVEDFDHRRLNWSKAVG